MSDNTNPLQRFDTVGCATGRKGIRPVQNSASAVPKGFPLDVRPNLELSQKKRPVKQNQKSSSTSDNIEMHLISTVTRPVAQVLF